ILHRYQYNILKSYPPIRTLGTIGFIFAMWIVDITGFKNSSLQLVFAAVSSIVLGFYSFTLPKCPPTTNTQKSILSSFGLDALILFKQKRMAIFFLFSILLGVSLQITNTYGSLFLNSFNRIPEYAESFGMKYSLILLSVSQISEALFILTIPFFLSRFGIKKIILLSMFAWALRFGLLGFGNPGNGLWILLVSMVVYGMAFDFFNISGSLFIEKKSPLNIKASAQGLFMMMTNGIGAAIGGYSSGAIVNFFSVSKNNILISRNWQAIWLVFAIYALIIGILFAICFKSKKQNILEKL
ncbi:MAG: MFS transporter, partial [Chitinophagaceae bacterium]